MSDKRFLVLDIETILDWTLVRSFFAMPESATLDDLQEQLNLKYKNGFPPSPYHIPICIALIDVDHETCKVQNATVLENPDEKILLQQFWKVTKLRKGNPIQTTFVSFNGRSFDLPCLFLRSLKHRIPIVPWDRNRYAFESSHDVCDDLSFFGAAGRVSLDLISKLLGLAGKTHTTGDMVEDLYNRGEKQRVFDYCMEDAFNTYLIWLTIKYARGELSQEKYTEAFESAASIIQSCRSKTDNFFTSTGSKSSETADSIDAANAIDSTDATTQ